MSDDIKRINIAEFRRLGYLQELNRQFLHPLGLALEVIIDDKTREESVGGVWDYREDPEGIYFEVENMDDETYRIHENRKNFVQAQLLERSGERKKRLGFVIEPVKRTKPKVSVKKSN